MDNELGAHIRTLRKERGLSQEALAQALKVSRQAVTKWEDGSSLPSTANLFALSGFFGVPLAELTGTPDGSKILYCLYAPYSILLPGRLFRRMFRSSAALIWRQTSTLWAGSLHICF